MATSIPEDQFREEDQVWLEAKHLTLPYQMCKLAPKCHGPFTITKKVSPVAYQLETLPTWMIHNMFHISLLTPYHEMIKHGANYNCSLHEMVNGEEEYKVEVVMRHCFFRRTRQLQYLVKWSGYLEADNTWEPQNQVFA